MYIQIKCEKFCVSKMKHDKEELGGHERARDDREIIATMTMSPTSISVMQR